MTKREEAIAIYNSVKETIKYGFPHWGDPNHTLQVKEGHCGIKSELLVYLLKQKGIDARYVEGRPTKWGLIIMKLFEFDVHFWVEAFVDNDWLVLDPVPDSGIARVIGDTKPGTHLCNPTSVMRWDELPPWYKNGYNMWLFALLRWFTNIQLRLLRHTKRKINTANPSIH